MHEQEYEKSPLQKKTSSADRTPANSAGTPEQNDGEKPHFAGSQTQKKAFGALTKKPQSDNPQNKSQNARPMNGKTQIFSGQHQEMQGQTDTQEYLTVAAKGKNARKSTMLLIGLFILGLLCLWFMIKKSSPKTASATTPGTEEAQIEMAITRLTGVSSEMFNRMDEIVNKFYEFSDVLQVKVNELVKNPFKHDVFLGDLKKASDIENKDSEMLRQQLQLFSIMQSEQGNCCMIDDKILYEGDSIRGFKVRQISNNFVKLEWEQDPILQKPHFENKSQNEAQTQSEGLEKDKTQIILKLSE
jgi:preprotein translocase subunit SecG